ncbi:hypothetical protein M0802_006390 [Mischocyttarus mexicanus]|nr:hypothetical protein M0802_006390 [Mischocyttarus mexicanus]
MMMIRPCSVNGRKLEEEEEEGEGEEGISVSKSDKNKSAYQGLMFRMKRQQNLSPCSSSITTPLDINFTDYVMAETRSILRHPR